MAKEKDGTKPTGTPTVPGTPLTPPASAPPSGTSNGKKPVEPKDKRFKRLAEQRMNKLLKMLVRVQALFNRNQYEWSDVQAAKVISILQAGVDEIKRRANGAKDEKALFTLGD